MMMQMMQSHEQAHPSQRGHSGGANGPYRTQSPLQLRQQRRSGSPSGANSTDDLR